MADAPRELVLKLNISAQAYLRYYRGTARQVLARSRDGKTVSFPAGLLRRFLGHDGIHGLFLIRHDGRGRLLSIERLEQG